MCARALLLCFFETVDVFVLPTLVMCGFSILNRFPCRAFLCYRHSYMLSPCFASLASAATGTSIGQEWCDADDLLAASLELGGFPLGPAFVLRDNIRKRIDAASPLKSDWKKLSQVSACACGD